MVYCVQMEGMVTDLQLAREKQQAFEGWQRANNKSSPIDLSVTVLTTGFWPAFKVRLLTPGFTLAMLHVWSDAVCAPACIASAGS